MRAMLNRQTIFGLLLILVALLPWERLHGLFGGGYSGPIAAVVVYESAESPTYTRDQLAAMASVEVASYMAGKNYPWYPRLDQNVQAPKDQSLPPIIVAAKSEAAGKPFPRLVILEPEAAKVLASAQVVDEASTLALLRKWGGQ
jgi:hypothetical protein